MDKTRVDDMLIEMISPKIKEIEEKFSSGKRAKSRRYKHTFAKISI